VAATDGATGTAALSGGWLTVAQQQAVLGYPDNPEYPGPVTTDHADPGVADPGKSGPPAGTSPPVPSTGAVPVTDLSGGTITDTAAMLGHSAPVAAFDSNAGDWFAPPGPIADTHSYDTGGTGRTEHVPVPRSPGWWRRTATGQTFNRQSQVTDTAGWAQLAANGRVNLNQDQGQNADAYDPFTIPYSERPLRANFAASAYPVDPLASVYGVDGDLADMYALGGQGNYGYTSPADPVISVTTPAGSPQGYEPVIGMEYVSG
jgi:hypothetical protein